jgi:hypothetical protein
MNGIQWIVSSSCGPHVTQDPRPDPMENAWRALVSQGLQAQWNVGKGPDRTAASVPDRFIHAR